MTYNGWKNYQTWNVALWIQNDETIYRSAQDYMRRVNKGRAPYRLFIEFAGLAGEKTPDGVKWLGRMLNLSALNDMMRELVS